MTGYESKKAAAQDKLAQPAQEPVACKHEWFRTGAMAIDECRCINCGAWNTVAPPQRPWVDLTDEDCKGMSAGDILVAMWVSRILKEKNT